MWKRLLPSRRGSFTLKGRRTTSGAVHDVSSAWDDWDAVMTAACTCLRVSKARQAARVPASVHVLFRPRVVFLQLTWLCHVDGMEDALIRACCARRCQRPPLDCGSRSTDGPSKCAWFCRRTDAMEECYGVVFFLLFIVTDDLALPMTSSRPPCASGCGGGPQRHHCPTDGQELAFFNL